MNRRQRLMIATLVIAAAGLVLPGFSSATFTAQTSGTGTVRAAADWTPPTVSVLDPGAAVKGITTVAVNASDAESGIQGVQLAFQPAAGGAWTAICSTTTSPYTCAWDTRALADGAYVLRAVATDRAGYSTTSSTVRTTVANSLTVSIASLPELVRGTVAIEATVSNTSGLSPVVRLEYSVPGSGTWSTVCAHLSSPYTCTVATAGAIANGSYDVRAVAVVGNATYTSATVRTLVDNQAPTVSMTDPGSPLTGTRTFAATATDPHSGVDKIVIQHATGTTWSTLCTIDAAPYSCSYNTSSLPNGTYSFRTIATDKAGNTSTSAAVANRTVTNVVTSITLADPGAYVRGTVALNASATSTGTIKSVKIQRSPAGATTWSDICTDTSAPYSCAWNTSQVADGAYDLRAIATDTNDKTTTSAVVVGRTVDNTGPTGVDVQAVNGGEAGQVDAGDVVTFIYSEQVDLTSILPGWNGGDTSVTGTLDAGFLANTTLNFDRSGRPPHLGSVNLNAFGGFFPSSYRFDATVSATTITTAGGAPRTAVTVRIVSGGSPRTSNSAVAMVWTPSKLATDLAGNTLTGSTVTETGARDVDF